MKEYAELLALGCEIALLEWTSDISSSQIKRKLVEEERSKTK